MYIKVNNGAIEKYPYSINELKADNPNISFPSEISTEILADFGVFFVENVNQPSIDHTQRIKEESPTLIDGKWTQTWAIEEKTLEEINAIVEELRADLYKSESDPLFFKWQRGESTEQEWLDKVAEIKARFPKVE